MGGWGRAMVGMGLLGSVLDSVPERMCFPWEWLECKLPAAPGVGRWEERREVCVAWRLRRGWGGWLEGAFLMPCVSPCL